MRLPFVQRSARSIFFSTVLLVSGAASAGETVLWQSWDAQVFTRAKAQKKLVLLDLQAVWCHWCHVMEEKTYSNADVVAEIKKDYLPIQADQDANPELARTYEDWGWPATIIFDSEGHELLKRAGYIEASELRELLQKLAKDPVPLKAEVEKPEPVSDLEKHGRALQESGYDAKTGGWKGSHKYLDRDFILEQSVREQAGDTIAHKRRVQTLEGVRKILDPVWGGLYQYSVDGDWNEPHYEKLLIYQADAVLAFATSYNYFHDEKDLAAAKQTAAYVERFLTSPEGAVYASQDADAVPGEQGDDYFKLDDKSRLARGVPRVDQHIYPRENGQMIEALVRLSEATDDRSYLDRALKAANYIVSKRARMSGGFSHSENKSDALALADQLAMGKAFLALHEVTGDRAWLAQAQSCADVMAKTFSRKEDGYLAFESTGPVKPKALAEENFAIARFATLLYHYTGQEADKVMAKRAFDFASGDEARDRVYMASTLLLALREIHHDPLHITVVGAKDDPAAKKLQAAAISYPEVYRRIEWFDRKEGPLPHGEVELPNLKKAAVFVCTGHLCSTPMTDETKVAEQIRRITNLRKSE